MFKEKRNHRRERVILSIDYAVDDETVNLFYVTSNISQKGVFVKTPNPLDQGTVLDLVISLHLSDDMSDAAERINVHGVVTHVKQKSGESGMGIRFEDLSDENWSRIRHFIEKKKRGEAEMSLIAQVGDQMKSRLSAIEEQSRHLQSELDDYHKDFDED